MKKLLVLYDFDGTLTKKDIFIDFLFYYFGYTKTLLILSRYSIHFALYMLGLYSAHMLKEKMVTLFFAGFTKEEFQKIAKSYTVLKLDKSIYKEALQSIQAYKKQNADIYIVTANIDILVMEFCNIQNIKLIATQLEVLDNKITGRLHTKNCNNEEKKKRILEEINIQNYADIHVYGNSSGDFAMMELATKKYYNFFYK